MRVGGERERETKTVFMDKRDIYKEQKKKKRADMQAQNAFPLKL